jgi:hypothetical protein
VDLVDLLQRQGEKLVRSGHGGAGSAMTGYRPRE